MSDVFTTKRFAGQDVPIRWGDAKGVVHAVEGATIHRGLTLLWPRCGCGDVPPFGAWCGFDEVECLECRRIDA